VTALTPEPDAAPRAELCSGCGAYLKWLDLPEPTPFELLPVEDLASTPLDVLAVQKGFGRPSLPDLGGPERHPCQVEDPAQ
jgi:formate dehydrogenase maturation protein FdhE